MIIKMSPRQNPIEEKSEVSKRFFTKMDIYDAIVKRVKELPGIDYKIQQYNYLYIVHLIIMHNTRNREDKPGSPICIQYIGKLFGKSNSETADIVRNLVEWKIIYQSSPAVIKEKCAKYQITAKYTNKDSYVIINVLESDATFISKIIFEEEQELIKDKLINKFLNISKSSLSVNSDGYDYFNNKYNLFLSNDSIVPKHGGSSSESAFLLSKSELLSLKKKKKITRGYGIEQRDIALYQILIGEFRCTRPIDKDGKKSRVYNNLTNLPRDHRKYISFDGKPILMTDISNSQILLTVPMIEKYYKVHSGKGALDMPTDIIKFREWAESGLFYENFSKLLHPGEMTPEQRKEMKIYIFREIWFSAVRRINRNRIKPVFKKKFPEVFKIIKALKFKNYKSFARELQRFEASIMVDKVAKRLLVKHKVLTLHDAIICTNAAILIEAETLINEALSKFGLTPKFKREKESKVKHIEVASTDVLPPPFERNKGNNYQDSIPKWGKNVTPLKKRNY
jgi:hypothetical protein